MHHARAICGIARSNDFVTPKFNMCPIMHMCKTFLENILVFHIKAMGSST